MSLVHSFQKQIRSPRGKRSIPGIHWTLEQVAQPIKSRMSHGPKRTSPQHSWGLSMSPGAVAACACAASEKISRDQRLAWVWGFLQEKQQQTFRETVVAAFPGAQQNDSGYFSLTTQAGTGKQAKAGNNISLEVTIELIDGVGETTAAELSVWYQAQRD